MATRLTTIIVMVIVGATFIAGLIVGAQRDDASGPVDLIIFNGKVYPGAGAKLQEAVAVRGNQILRVGTNREIKRLRRAQTVVVDAHGAAVVPGFNDAHVRLIDGALTLDRMDLAEAATPEQIAAAVRAYADANPSRAWILGRAGNPAVFSVSLTARRILDDAVADRPVFLVSDDQDIAWVNSKALDAAGVTRRTRTTPRNAIARDSRTGEPTGVLKSSAIKLVTRVLPQPTRAEKIAALHEAISEAHKLGVTSVQTVSAGHDELALLSTIRKLGDLTLRVYASIEVSPDVSAKAVEELDAVRTAYPDDPLIKAGGIELVCDPGPAACDPAQLERAVTLLDRHAWQITVRAQDEDDVHAALEAFERAVASNPEPLRGRRHRLDDVDRVSLDDLPRFSRTALVADPGKRDEWSADRTLLIWRELESAGVRVLRGSHWPDASFDPLTGLQEAVASLADAQPAGDTSSRPVPIEAAIDASTSQTAYGSFDEQRKGTLAPGMLADIVILSNDIFEEGSNNLKDAEVEVTIFDGQIVYQRGGSATDN